MFQKIALLTQHKVIAAEDQIVAVYRSAFALPPYNETEENVIAFRETLGRYRLRSGFRCVVAWDSAQSIVGFACGYASEPGFWWHDTVRSLIDTKNAGFWFANGFEVAEIAVLPAAQGQGIGGRLHDRLLCRLPHQTALLQNKKDAPVPLALYRGRGWLVLDSDFWFPGAEESCLIMGRHLKAD